MKNSYSPVFRRLAATAFTVLALTGSTMAQDISRPHASDITPNTALILTDVHNTGQANWGLAYRLRLHKGDPAGIFSRLNLPKGLQRYTDTILLAQLAPEKDYELSVAVLKQNGTKWDTLDWRSGNFRTERFMVATESPSRAVYDSVTFHATVGIPVHNPAAYGMTPEQRMYIRFSYGQSQDTLQQTKTDWKEVFANAKSVRISVRDSIRVNGLQMSKEYFYRAEYAIGTAGSKTPVASGKMMNFISAEGIGIRSEAYSYSGEPNKGTLTADISAYRENFRGKVIFQYWKIPFVRGAERLMQQSFEQRGIKLKEISNRIQRGPDFREFSVQDITTGALITRSAEFTADARSLYAVRTVLHDTVNQKYYYLPYDQGLAPTEENSLVHLVHSTGQEPLGIRLLPPYIDEKSREIIIGAILTRNSGDQLDHQPNFRLHWDTSAALTDKPATDLRIETRNAMEFGYAALRKEDYRPYTRYYMNVVYKGSNGSTLRSDTLSFLTPSVAGLEMQRVQTIQEQQVLPKFFAGVRANDAGASVYFEYGTTAQYGSRTATVHIDTRQKRDHYEAIVTGSQALQPHTVYNYRVVMYDSATKQTFHGPNLSFLSSIDASLGYEWFVQGMKGVMNTFSLPASLGNLTKAVFSMSTLSGMQTITDSHPSDGLSASFDMGDAYPGSGIYVTAFNSQGDTVIRNFNGKLGIIARPGWLPDNGQATVNAASRTISYSPTVQIPFPSLNRTIGGGVKFFGNKSVGAGNFALPLEITYHFSTRNSDVNLPQIQFGHSQDTKAGSIGIDLSGQVFVDSSFNLLIETNAGITGPTIWVFGETAYFNFEDGLVEGELSTGISVTPVFNLDLLVGNMNGWGLVRSEGKSSYFDAGLSFFGGVTGSLSVCDGAGSVDASLGVTAPVLLGMAFANKPTEYKSFIWGGDVTVAGEISVDVCGFNVYNKTKTFYQTSWGTIPGIMASNGRKNSPSLLSGDNAEAEAVQPLDLPDYDPMAHIAEEDSTLAVVWMDDVNSKEGRLLFSQITFNGNTTGNAFSKPLTVVEHGYGMSHPRVSLTDNHSAFITWTQSRYHDDNFDNGVSMYEYFLSQDIWGAYYDAEKKAISSIFRIADDTTKLISGRLEGKPDIIALGNNTAMLTWTGGEAYQRRSDIWYSLVTVNGASANVSEAQKIAEIRGENKNVRVHALGENKALAVWINNPDNREEIRDNRIMSALWDGSSWTVQELLPEIGRMHYQDLALDFTNGKGLLALTRTTTDSSDGIGVNELLIANWNNSTQQWELAGAELIRDTAHFFRMPSVSVSEAGIAAVMVQRQNMFRPGPDAQHMGDVDLYTRNLESAGSAWKLERNNPFLTDTNTHEWELDGGFVNGNIFLALAQERDTVESGYHVPQHGIVFGRQEHEMVLRAVRISNALMISDAAEPQTATGTEDELPSGNSPVFTAAAYPNPFASRTNIVIEHTGNSLVSIEIFDLLGNSLAKSVQNLDAGRHVVPFSLQELPNGVYSCVIRSGGHSSVIKLVLNR